MSITVSPSLHATQEGRLNSCSQTIARQSSVSAEAVLGENRSESLEPALNAQLNLLRNTLDQVRVPRNFTIYQAQNDRTGFPKIIEEGLVKLSAVAEYLELAAFQKDLLKVYGKEGALKIFRDLKQCQAFLVDQLFLASQAIEALDKKEAKVKRSPWTEQANER